MNEKLQPLPSLATPLTTTTPTTSIPITETEEYCFETTFSETAEAKAHEANASNELYLYASTATASATASGNLCNPNIPTTTTTTISGNFSASGSSGITNTYGIPEVPTDFGGTLKSNKGSRNVPGNGSGANSNLHSPSRQHGGVDGDVGNAGGCSACFGEATGSKRGVLESFWPTLLANFGICVLLLGYVMIGSFIFLTIENSGGDIAKAITSARDARTHGSDVNAHDPAAAWHFTISPKMPQKFIQQQSLSSASSSTSSWDSVAAGQQQQQTLQPIKEATSIASNLKQQTSPSVQHTPVQQSYKYTHSTDNATHIMSAQRTSAVGAAAALTLTHVSSKSSTFALPDEETGSNDNTLPEHNVHIAGDETDSQPRTAALAAATSNNANVDYELQTMNLRTNVDGAAQRHGDGDEDMDVLLTVEDLERQSTVENIWDITVSLNILYKENWTRLAALEIAKFQDQLVKRLVMDLTLSNGATSTNGGAGTETTNMMTSNDAGTQTIRNNNNNVAGGDDSSNLGHGTLTISQHRKHFNGRRQQQQKKSLWLLHLQQQQKYHQRQQQLRQRQLQFEWNLASAFLYSLTVITTVGYGTITPRTTLGRMATIGYATLGIPLTLIYLASMGSLLARLTRVFCTRAICCCCCNCCCYGNSKRYQQCGGYNRSKSNSIISKQQQVFEQRKCELKLKQANQTAQQLQQQQQQHLPYCYVRPPAVDCGGIADVSTTATQMQNASYDSLSSAGAPTSTAAGNDAAAVQHCARVLQWSLVAPVAICALLLILYVCVGAVVISLLEQWPLIDGVYFCFMSLTTIGFCDLLPGLEGGNGSSNTGASASSNVQSISIWFCAFYILTGLTLTSMCVNLLHEEILLRMRLVVKFKKVSSAKELKERSGFYGAPPP